MATRPELINRALQELGERRVQNLSEIDIDGRPTTRRARIAASAYEGVKQSLLNAHAWSWLERRVRLSQPPRALQLDRDGNPIPNRYASLPGGQPRYAGNKYNQREFRYAFVLEDQKGGIRALYTDNAAGSHPRTDRWAVRDGFLSADYPEVVVAYQEEKAEAVFPPLVENAMVLRLCQRMAPAFTEDPEAVRMFKGMADDALRDARRVDAQGQPPPRLTSFSYLEARIGGRRGYGLR